MQQRADIHNFALALDAANARDIVQNAVDQPFHAMHAPAQQIELLANVICSAFTQIFFDPLRKVSDPAQRRFEIVRCDIGELVKLAVALFQRGSVRTSCSPRSRSAVSACF